MKKVLAIILVLMMMFSICACSMDSTGSTGTKYTVKLENGTVEEMTFKEIEAIGDNELKYENTYAGAMISGSGTIKSIEDGDHGYAEIDLKEGFILTSIPLDYAATLSVGDKFEFNGALCLLPFVTVTLNCYDQFH